MRGSQRMKTRAAMAIILSCFLSGLFAVGTVADGIGFLSPIVGSNPGVTIAGVKSGGAPWVVSHGFAVLNDEGRLRVELRGLILPSVGTPGPRGVKNRLDGHKFAKLPHKTTVFVRTAWRSSPHCFSCLRALPICWPRSL